MSSTTLTTSATSSTNTTDATLKRYSLVKWLENSQFDSQNEWLGRLTSVPHSSIIDFDADELKAGMEINVVRNNGEIWRAQVIIPKTASNTIDLPPSSVKKIRTKAMGSTGGAKTIASLDHHDTSSSSLDQTTLIDLNELSSADLTHATSTATTSSTTTTVPIISTLNTSNLTPNPNSSLIILTAQPASASTSVASPLAKQKQTNNNNNNTKQEWQFLQTALNDDFYTTTQTSQDQANNTVIKLNNLTPITLTTNSNSTQQQIVTVSDLNIETILQMQCDLLEQQKELKSIELETMEQLRLLQQNISKLARKFDSFETSCAKYFSLPCNGDLARAKNVLTKFNSSIELIKDLQQTNNTVMPSSTLGPSTSTLSSSSSPTTATTTVTLTNDLENHAKPTTTIVNLLPSSSSTPTTTGAASSTKEEESNNNENLDQSNTTNNSTTSAAAATADAASASTTANKTTTRSQETQMALNRYLRESVKQKLGAEFLISHAISDIPSHIMQEIKREAFNKYLPNDQRPIKAWGLAMASLRCLKRDLVKNKNKQLAAPASSVTSNELKIIQMDVLEDVSDSSPPPSAKVSRPTVVSSVANTIANISNAANTTRRQLTLAAALTK